MRFRYLEDAMDFIVVEHPEKIWCSKHQALTGLMVKDTWTLFKDDMDTRFKVVTKCCEKELTDECEESQTSSPRIIYP